MSQNSLHFNVFIYNSHVSYSSISSCYWYIVHTLAYNVCTHLWFWGRYYIDTSAPSMQNISKAHLFIR